MADPLERLTNLLALLLETRQPLTLDRIAHELAGHYPEELTARRAAFERDKAMLRAEGVPIRQTIQADGGTAYRIERADYELGDLGLTAEETRALQLAVAAVHLGVEWADDALLKVTPAAVLTDADAAIGPTAALPTLPALGPLFEAVAQRAPVEFTYRGEARALDPFGLLSRSGRWYLVGFDHRRQAVRSFRVDRIDGAVTAGAPGAFEVPGGFDLSAAEAVDADVRVDRLRAGSVRREMGEAAVVATEPDGAIVVRVPCANRDAFRSWLLGLAEHAEVLAPADVRAEIVAWLEAV